MPEIENLDFFIVPSDTGSFSPVLTVDSASVFSFNGIAYTPIIQAPLPPAWQSGMEPLERADGIPNTLILIIALLVVLFLANFRSLRAMLTLNFDELIEVRQGRDNVFDDRPASLAAMQVLTTVLFVVCGGFLLAAVASGGTVPTHSQLWLVMAALAGYYLIEYVAYQAVGYTFAHHDGRREWVRGFCSSISLLSLAIALPAMVAIFYPDASRYMAFLAIILFFLSKALFILKGFRIFFDNFFSLLYFILYLCTLEIIPLIFLYALAVKIMI